MYKNLETVQNIHTWMADVQLLSQFLLPKSNGTCISLFCKKEASSFVFEFLLPIHQQLHYWSQIVWKADNPLIALDLVILVLYLKVAGKLVDWM